MTTKLKYLETEIVGLGGLKNNGNVLNYVDLVS